MKYGSLREYLDANSIPEPNSGCYLWTAAISGGYGKANYRGHRDLAHRMSYFFAKGPIPQGLFVCHHCDNPPCINPDHLFLGTALDNAADMIRKGRSRPYRRAKGRTALRTDAVPLDVRMAIKQSSLPVIVLAAEFSVPVEQMLTLKRVFHMNRIVTSPTTSMDKDRWVTTKRMARHGPIA